MIRVGGKFGKRIKSLQLDFEEILGRKMKRERFSDEVLEPLMAGFEDEIRRFFKNYEK